ncbi:23S rRNA (pseudouridine(1915)-N(3))-methyltransferase RlmH [Spirobacillus cienkowskii]|uniref:23S rRNA (pseudouridine(1915)-N(3))-methyltransferase RlmH n=1 Tax=Spirobacillus cienkowskii TaxID=495820 RepID=UPI0030CCA64E
MRYIILTPWKISRNSVLFNCIQDFVNRSSHYISLQHIYPSHVLSSEQHTQFYCKELKKLSVENPLCIALDENGKQLSSDGFAKELSYYELHGEKAIVFCVGGAYGLPQEIVKLGRFRSISLSSMTLPHEMALAVLVEQIYRARCIIASHPYHHADPSAFSKAISVRSSK